MTLLSDAQVFLVPDQYAHIKSSPGQRSLFDEPERSEPAQPAVTPTGKQWGPEQERKHPRGAGGRWDHLGGEERAKAMADTVPHMITKRDWSELTGKPAEEHREHVQKAVNAGATVPEHVLAEYPGIGPNDRGGSSNAHQELLQKSAAYRDYGPNHDRGIASAADDLEQALESTNRAKFVPHLAETLKRRLDAKAPPTAAPDGMDPVAYRKGQEAQSTGIRNPAAAGLKPNTLPWRSWLAGFDGQKSEKPKETSSQQTKRSARPFGDVEASPEGEGQHYGAKIRVHDERGREEPHEGTVHRVLNGGGTSSSTTPITRPRTLTRHFASRVTGWKCYSRHQPERNPRRKLPQRKPTSQPSAPGRPRTPPPKK